MKVFIPSGYCTHHYRRRNSASTLCFKELSVGTMNEYSQVFLVTWANEDKDGAIQSAVESVDTAFLLL
jgi:hypothetical protein